MTAAKRSFTSSRPTVKIKMNSYHVLELVGEGSFGRVHKGMTKFTGQVVALKFMPKMARSNKELQSLKKEIEIMSNLQHPNIVKLFDSFETETEVVVVTEYAEGQLFQIIEDDGSLAESQVCEIACQLVSALYYLHSRRILHRDMKPQNILFDKNGVVKLCDFGFARAMSVSTMVLTSIKGTPLYMSPELVAEKPYDHTADLWSLGCILYELHTGAPPFYTNSIFHLVQLIVKDPIKWPDAMSSTCMSFLKGLLTKDPQKRLSWPDLLHHPFVADGVQVIPDTDVFSPLTVTPDPDMLALKLKQMAEKTSLNSGESRILRKVKEQTSQNNAKKPSDSAKDMIDELESSALTVAPPSNTSLASIRSTLKGTPRSTYPKNHTGVRSSVQKRGPISQDYKREFPSIEVGPRLKLRTPKNDTDVTETMSSSTTVDSEEFWEKLVEESDPTRQKQEPFNYSTIIVKLKSTILVFKQQLGDGLLKNLGSICLALKVLQNLILTSDLAVTKHIGGELGLPCLFIDLVHDCVENSDFIEQPLSLPTLGEMFVVLLVYWEKNHDGLRAENRPEQFIKPFLTILNQADLDPLAPLAASILSLFSQRDVAVNADVNRLTSLLKELVSGPHQRQLPLPPGWGLCDGLLSLLLHTLSEHDDGSSCWDPLTFHHIWEGIGTALARTKPDMDFCSTNGLHFLMYVSLLVFSKDPYSYISLFSESKSTFLYTLAWLLSSECSIFAEGHSGTFEEGLSRESLVVLSCHFLCLPFALDLNSHSTSRILHLYDSCNVVQGLLQVIQTLPVSLAELPVSLLRRLLLRDRQRLVSRLSKAARGFFSAPALSPSGQQAPSRTAGSLLSDLLQLDELGDSAVELLSLLYLVTRFCPNSGRLQLHLESSVLHQALTHSYDPIKAATCKVLGNLYPLWSSKIPNLQLNIFKGMIELLEDSNVHVRRAACLSVGKWLGYIALEANTRRPDGNLANTADWLRVKGIDDDTHKRSSSERGVAVVTIVNELADDDMRQWLEEARLTGATLASLTSDPDDRTRLHACAALGNLLHVEGAVPGLLEENVSRFLLRAACTDSHNVVREAAIATLSLYAQQKAIRQVLVSLDARQKLLQAQHAPLQCDYLPLIRQLQTDETDKNS
ncbi:serine/threonine-protein kinase 36 isoform X2 [Phyllopteryx taeniolatus]|uniref:serine/threonine-protein kinase 36 isoform X2 n=1 Tax=Phyllopteryx taeniolatus TaxID=161469 RepID=UPI002AD50DCA|nr:serine/threonine-protein kinase 36 isoform X2 [Phyllopteryx taeniolatus]